LIERCRRQDAQAWSELVDRFQALVYSVARRHGLQTDDAEDVFVTTFQNLLRSIDRIESGAALPRWLAVTASRESLKLIRISARTTDLDGDGMTLDEIVADEEIRAEQSAIEADEAFRLRSALEKIGDRCRELLRMLYFEGDPSYQEIGTTLGMPVGAIGPTRARCIDKLRAVLKTEGFFEQ